MTVVPEGAIEITPGGLVTQAVGEFKVYLLDWDSMNLAAGVLIDSSSFSVAAIRPRTATAPMLDNAAIVDGQRQAWVRVDTTAVALGGLFELANTIETDESPAQTLIRKFRILVE